MDCSVAVTLPNIKYCCHLHSVLRGQPYNHKSSSSQWRNFSDLECSVAVHYACNAKHLGEGILRIRGLAKATPYSENALPLGLYITRNNLGENSKVYL